MRTYIKIGLASLVLIVFTSSRRRILVSNNEIITGNTVVAFGNSITIGSALASPSTDRYVARYCEIKGYTEINNAVQGTTLMNAVPLNRIMSPNMYDRAEIDIPDFIEGTHRYLLFAYGTNDCGLFYSTYNTTDYKTQYNEIIDIAISKGWSTNRIIIVGGYYHYAPDCWEYYSVDHSWSTDTATVERNISFIQANRDVAIQRKCIYINFRSVGESLGVDGLESDMLHPNEVCNTAMAEYMANIIK